MTNDIFLWIFGAALITLIGWGITITNTLNKVRDMSQTIIDNQLKFDTLIEEHKKATDKQNELLKTGIHYFKWWIKTQKGEEPPPNVPGME